FLDNLIGGLLVNAGHRADFLANFVARADKHWIDQASGAKPGFANEVAKGFAATKAAGSLRKRSHGRLASMVRDETPADSTSCKAATIDSSDGSWAWTMRTRPI